jgi:hypothetical protein
VELQNLHSSPNKIRMIQSLKMRWTGNVACMGEKRNAYKIVLVEKPEGWRALERPRWEDNIKMDLRETGLGGIDWIHLI